MQYQLSVPSESGRWLLPELQAVVAVAASYFQYPQSRVVGCYEAVRQHQAGPDTTFSTLRVGSLVATTMTKSGISAAEALSVPSESGRWLLPTFRIGAHPDVPDFQYPQSRVVGCYYHTSYAARRRDDALSVPSESGRWLLRYYLYSEQHRLYALFQYPQSRVVGCYLEGDAAIAIALLVFQYPQSRVVGCYYQQRLRYSLCVLFQYPQSRVVGCYKWTTLILAIHGFCFQYPQSRVVGCYHGKQDNLIW